MIATVATIKTILGITGTTYNTLIHTYIPIVTEDIVEYCNNHFIKKPVELYTDATTTNDADLAYSNTFVYVDSDPDTITDADAGFVTAGFVDGDDIYVSGTRRNDGFYTLAGVAAGTLTLTDTIDSLTAEDITNRTSTIYLVQFPKSLVPVFSQMVGWLVLDQNNQTGGFKSEKLGDYSYTLSDSALSVGANQYPTNIVNGLNAFRQLRMS